MADLLAGTGPLPKDTKMTYHKQDEWLPLVGETVQIRNNGRFVRAGIVDAVTIDDAILWLAADGVIQRQLIARADGYEVWMTYKWETAGASRSVLRI